MHLTLQTLVSTCAHVRFLHDESEQCGLCRPKPSSQPVGSSSSTVSPQTDVPVKLRGGFHLPTPLVDAPLPLIVAPSTEPQFSFDITVNSQGHFHADSRCFALCVKAEKEVLYIPSEKAARAVAGEYGGPMKMASGFKRNRVQMEENIDRLHDRRPLSNSRAGFGDTSDGDHGEEDRRGGRYGVPSSDDGGTPHDASFSEDCANLDFERDGSCIVLQVSPRLSLSLWCPEEEPATNGTGESGSTARRSTARSPDQELQLQNLSRSLSALPCHESLESERTGSESTSRPHISEFCRRLDEERARLSQETQGAGLDGVRRVAQSAWRGFAAVACGWAAPTPFPYTDEEQARQNDGARLAEAFVGEMAALELVGNMAIVPASRGRAAVHLRRGGGDLRLVKSGLCEEVPAPDILTTGEAWELFAVSGVGLL